MTVRDNNLLNITTLCTVAGVSRSGYYTWLKAAKVRENREEGDQRDFNVILDAYKYRGYSKGARSIHMRLSHMEPMVVMNVKKIRRLIDKYGLKCPIRKANPYRRMAQAMKTSHIALNLLNRQFRVYRPRKVLLTGITYLFYGNHKKAYLSVIMDAYTKQTSSYALSESLEVDFVLETVNILLSRHKISLAAEILINSDQGVQYTSLKFIEIIKNAEIRQSMSRRANCWDNVPQESFFGHMKDKIDLDGCNSFTRVIVIIDDWMDYYNNERYQ
ncbi:MAG: IS3 family transposase [Oscillospiraceae bacterium]|jgi:transposase InsO family protein|nr:IS3 family transposase [Oscillospiraceae bacterium]